MIGSPGDPRHVIGEPKGVQAETAQPPEATPVPQRYTDYLASIVEFSSDAIVGVDLNGVVASWNRTAEQLLGYSAEEAIGRPVDILSIPERLDEERNIFARVKQGNRVDQYESWRLRKNGSRVPVFVTASPIRDGAGNILGVSMFLHDHTEKKRIEEELKTLQAEMIHLTRWTMMGTMASSLAHELNQPLMATMNFIQAARNVLGDAGNKARAVGLLDRALKEVDLAGGIVRSLRSFIEKRDSPRKPENLNIVLQDALALSMTVATEAKERLVKTLSPNLPPVTMDKVQIQQVLLNLVRNAAEAMQGLPDGHIVIETKRAAAGLVLVSVSDDGPGLSPDILKQPFQAFVTTKKDGMGLGLSICRKIIEAHGGRIWAEPNQPRGVTFHFQLPFMDESHGR